MTFASDTDTEVLAHLIALADTDLESAVRAALARVEGTYGLAVLDAREPGRIIAARNGSPVILGIGDKEMFVASDVAALVRHTHQVAYLDDGELAAVDAGGFHASTLDNRTRSKPTTEIDWGAEDYDRGGHGHFMRKEILEQPEAVEGTLRGRLEPRFGTAHLGGLQFSPRELRAIRRVCVLGCGSAYYAGIVGAQMIESLARLPTTAEPASEFRYRDPVIEDDTLYVAVSQSGETYDTLAAVQEVKRKGGNVLGIVNVVGSSIARACEGGIYVHAGPEVSVTSTKTFTCTRRGLRPARPAPRPDPRPRPGRRPADHRRARGAAGPDPGDPRAGGRDRRPGRRAGGGPGRVLHRARARLPRRAGGRPEAQGGLLRARGGLPGLGAQARAAGARGLRAPDRGDRARRSAAREEPLVGRAGPRPRGTRARGRPPRRWTGSRTPRSSSRGPSPSSTRSCSASRCSCWPTTLRWRWAATSTSRATWPRASPWSSPRRGGGPE